ncbi:SDR family NAD(P)-dependent oxidoreductase [Nocardiopsis sp. NRRL B-16309]|uniref:SDR family NAD(P)-dependent oxidoreductase n=1 Tax=Nocardiopsis sp. NRRL B-16309 TaxID=1519494 RepID=UPI0006AE79F7|nr:SDR family oxidoreductase [Nocardiopsis sp. NRRL B-16309]KOX12626.1 3-hydroxyacyl-CoA dehydrogenase [Nocardiopsis sp. NRRL B-16309]
MADSVRRVVVSGGSGGIGRAIVVALASEGYEVVALGRDSARLAALEREAGAYGLAVRTEVCDLRDEQQAVSVAERLEPVSVLVNNAGTARTAPLRGTGLELWEDQIRVNATSAFLLTRTLLNGMLERDHGRVVFIASTAALVGARYTAAYTASKHAMLGLARAVAAEVSGTGVTSNAVCPTFVRSPMTDRSVAHIVERTGRDAGQAEAALAAASPLGRLVEPEEVAAAVAYFVSPAARAVNGQTLTIDGGGIHS